MLLFCLLHGNGHLIFFHQPLAMSLIHPRAILHPDLMSPDPVGAWPWAADAFGLSGVMWLSNAGFLMDVVSTSSALTI